jgi:hypothetical protein
MRSHMPYLKVTRLILLFVVTFPRKHHEMLLQNSPPVPFRKNLDYNPIQKMGLGERRRDCSLLDGRALGSRPSAPTTRINLQVRNY